MTEKEKRIKEALEKRDRFKTLKQQRIEEALEKRPRPVQEIKPPSYTEVANKLPNQIGESFLNKHNIVPSVKEPKEVIAGRPPSPIPRQSEQSLKVPANKLKATNKMDTKIGLFESVFGDFDNKNVQQNTQAEQPVNFNQKVKFEDGKLKVINPYDPNRKNIGESFLNRQNIDVEGGKFKTPYDKALEQPLNLNDFWNETKPKAKTVFDTPVKQTFETNLTEIQKRADKQGFMSRNVERGAKQFTYGLVGALKTIKDVESKYSGQKGFQQQVFNRENDKAFKEVLDRLNEYNQAVGMENIEKDQQFWGDVVTGITQMIPSIGLSVINPTAGLSVIGVTSGGSASQNARNEGASELQALLYGSIVGSAEVAMERLFIKQFTKLLPSKFKAGLLNRATENTVRNMFQLTKEVGKGSFAEGVEEFFMVPIEQGAKKFVYDNSVTYQDIFNLEEMVYSFFVGATIGAGFSATTLPSNIKTMAEAEKYIKENVTPTIMSAMALPENTKGYQMAKSFIDSRRTPNFGELNELERQVESDFKNTPVSEIIKGAEESVSQTQTTEEPLRPIEPQVTPTEEPLVPTTTPQLEPQRQDTVQDTPQVNVQVTPQVSDIIQQRFKTDIFKRVEEVGRVEKPNFDKPQGLYVAPDIRSDLTENLESDGGTIYRFKKNVNANDLIVQTDMFRTNRGLVGESAGIGALRQFIGDGQVTELVNMGKKELANFLANKYPKVEWDRYFDQQEMLEGYAGLMAREKGYDGILALDKNDTTGSLDEYVALTKNALTEIKTDKPQVKTPKQVEPEVKPEPKADDKHMGFKEKDRVKYTDNNGNELTGTIRGFNDYSTINPRLSMMVDIDVDQVATVGRVPIGRREMIPIQDIELIDGTKPKTTDNESTTKPKESIIEVGDKKPKKEGVTDVNVDGEIKDSNTEKVPEIIPETTRAGENEGSPRDVIPSSDEGTRDGDQAVDGEPTRGPKENEPDRESETDRLDSEGVLGEDTNDIATRVIGDYRIQTGDLDIPTGEKTRYKSNVEAIKLVLQLEKEGRRATYEEQKTLIKYVGWGGIKNVFDVHNEKWRNEYKELKELLTPRQWENANRTILNAHYTSPEIIGAMYDIAKHLGFKNGNILEPSSGVGRFAGLLPIDMQKNSSMFMVEIDEITSLIAKYLYPDTIVKGMGFEEVDIPDNYFDLAISNVPFANMRVNDPKMEKRDRYFTQSLHNYFFVKTLDKVKEGGLIIYITSTGTLDAQETKLREYINRKAEVVGAYRLPSDTFKKSANTEVVSDLIILRKRQKGELPSKSEIESIVQTKFGNMNEYFQNNPENLLGVLEDSRYENQVGLKPKGDTVALLKERIAELPQNIFKVGKSDIKSLTVDEEIEALTDIKEGAYFVDKDGIYQKNKGKKIKVDVLVEPDEGTNDRTKKARQTRLNNKIKRMTDLIAIKDSIKDLIVMQMKAEGEVDLRESQNKLNTLYEAFVKKFGPVAKHSKDIYEDPDAYLLNTLEIIEVDEKGEETYTKSNIFTERVYKPYKRQTTAKNVDEALRIVLYEDAKIDLQRISDLINSDVDTVKESLKGKIFADPNGGWELRADYLSGNVVEKLAIAKEAAKLDDLFNVNVTELEKIQPIKKEYGDFVIKMGALWIPEDIMTKILKKATDSRIIANKSLVSGKWDIKIGSGLMSDELDPYGKNASDVLTKIVNNIPITLKYKDRDGNDVVDAKQTALARAKAREIAQLFDEAINEDMEIQDALVESYNAVNNVTVERQFEKFEKTYIGQSPVLKYRPHQVQAIERGIYGGNLLLAHDVGFGKTFIMIGMAMELKRTGLASKPMFVVPKEKLADFKNDALYGYPQAKVLVATEADFTKDKIKSLLGRIATNNWDMVIIAHPSFGRIPVSNQLQEEFINNEIAELREVMESARYDDTKKYTLGDIQKQINNLQVKLSKLSENKLDMLNFEQLGVDYLFVDEAHEFKNLGFATIHSGTAGINNKHVSKTDDFYMKTKYITSLHGNKKGLIFATATPVTNALNESYTMFKYLRPDILERARSSSFDAWISNFGVIDEKPEIKAGGIIKYTKRFRNFFNLEDFFRMFKEFADMKYDARELGLKLPKLKNGVPTRVLIELHPEYRNWIQNELLVRINNLKPKPQKGDDNALSLSGLARKATADMRLVGDYGDFEGSKVNVATKKIIEIYKKTNDYKGTQLIFFERSTSNIPGSEFDATHDLIQKLIDGGIPKDEIARFDKYNSSKQKEQLFADINTGKVRVMIGTYAKMSTGINVQSRLVALHEIDTPYRPADVLQAEGRMIRQGNLHAEWGKDVEILRYVLSDPTSYDAVMWGILETKMVAINKLMLGELESMEFEDDDNPQAIAERQMLLMKADALGDYRIIRQTELNKEIPAIEADRNLYYKQVNKNKKIVRDNPEIILKQKQWLKDIEKDIELYNSNDSTKYILTINGKEFDFTNDENIIEENKKIKEEIAKIEKENKNLKKGEKKKLPKKKVTQFELASKELEIALDKAYRNDGDTIIGKYRGISIFGRSRQARTIIPKGRYDHGNIGTGNSFGYDINKILKLIDDMDYSRRRIQNSIEAYEQELKDAKEKITDKQFKDEDKYQELIQEKTLIDTEIETNVPITESQTKYRKDIKTVDEKLTANVDQRKSDQRGSLRIKPKEDLAEKIITREDVIEKDRQVLKEMNQSRADALKIPLLARTIDGLINFKKNTFRGAFPELKRGGEYADLRAMLLRNRSMKNISMTKTIKFIQGYTEGLNSTQYELMNYKVMFLDLIQEAKDGRPLPFGIEGLEQLQRLLDGVNKQIGNDPLIDERIQLRKELQRKVADDLIDAFDDLGMNIRDRFDKEDYMRHIVLEYVHSKFADKRSKLKVDKKRSYLKYRKGTEKNILFEFILADAEVLSQMLVDLESAKLVKKIRDGQHNIRKSLEKQAKRMNDEAMERIYISEAMDPKTGEVMLDAKGNRDSETEKIMRKYKQNIAMSFSNLSAMAEIDKLWLGDNNEYAGIVSALNNKNEKHPKMFKYLNELAEKGDEQESLSAKTILKYITKQKDLIATTLGENYQTWQKLIPEDHSRWSFNDGKIFRTVYSIPDKMALELINKVIETANISENDLDANRVQGKIDNDLVLPTDVAITLNEDMQPLHFEGMAYQISLMWKQWQLISPRRIFKYNIRNTTGDLDSILGLTPQALKYVTKAITDLYKVYVQNKSMSPELNGWFEQGGMSSFLQAHDIGDIKQLEIFLEQLHGRDLNFVKKWFRTARHYTDFRESIMRYATYLYVLDELNKGNTVIGGARWDEVISIKDKNMKAYWVSNKTVGDYADMSPTVQIISAKYMPFFRFTAQNLTKYFDVIRNAMQYDQFMESQGKQIAGSRWTGASRMTLIKIGRMSFQLLAFTTAIKLWNYLMFGDDEEEKLSQQQRTRLYLYLWNDKDGKPIIFDRIGVLTDFLEWFGLSTIDDDIVQMIKNNRSLQEQAIHMIKQPVNKIVNALVPIPKTIAETVFNRSTYPDFFRMRTIKDRGQYIFRSLGLGAEYDEFFGKPRKEYSETFKDLFFYTIDYKQSAYFDILDAKRKYKDKVMGIEQPNVLFSNAKSKELYNYKLALRYGDEESANKYLEGYIKEGGTKESYMSSISDLSPTADLGADRQKFIDSLTGEQQAKYELAVEFYENMIKNSKFVNPEFLQKEILYSELKSEASAKIKKAKETKLEKITGRVKISEDKLSKAEQKQIEVYNKAIKILEDPNTDLELKDKIIKVVNKTENVLDLEKLLRNALSRAIK